MVTRVAEGVSVLPASRGLAEIGGEAGLVARLRAGEAEAIQEIFQAYFERLYGFIYHNVDGDQAAAEDIVQDTFLAAIKTGRSFQGHSQVYTWLAAIAHHKIGDYYRKLKREREKFNRFQNESSRESAGITENAKSAEKLAESAEVKLAVELALQKLSWEYRQVILLKYIEEMTVADIGQIMNRSPKSVEGLLSRARQALRQNLGDY